jgi:hypothetical protein
MRMNRRYLAIVLPAAALVLSAFALRPQADETDAIRATLQYYLDGHATGDPEIMARAFHPSARLQFIRNGEVSIRSVDDYLGGMRGEPPQDESQRERRIVMIDYEGTAAVARIELDYPSAFFADYMQLLKVEGEWKIVNKIFHIERK